MRLFFTIAGAMACVAGLGFLIAAAALWLSTHFGALTSNVVMGVALVATGGLVIGVLRAAREGRPADQAGSTTQGFFESISPMDLRGLALIFENRPVLASALALVLGFEKGLRKNGRRPSRS